MPEGFLTHTKRWTPHSTPARELKRAMAQSPPLQYHHGGLSSKGHTSTHSLLSTWKENRSQHCRNPVWWEPGQQMGAGESGQHQGCFCFLQQNPKYAGQAPQKSGAEPSAQVVSSPPCASGGWFILLSKQLLHLVQDGYIMVLQKNHNFSMTWEINLSAFSSFQVLLEERSNSQI